LAIRRFRRRQYEPPETFSLIGLGLIAGAAAALINFGIAANLVAPSWDLLGRRLLSEGMVLLLVLGVGGFLGPRLLGYAAVPQFGSRQGRQIGSTRPFYAGAGLAVLLSLVGEYGFGIGPMAFLRAAVVTAVISATVQPWRLPSTRTTLAWCVWISHWSIIASVWLVAALPLYRIDLLHVLFIGGFSLLILAVATRVTLSHGGHSLALEQRSWPLRIGSTTMLIAMLARVGAPFAPSTYFEHLAFAGLLWVAGMLAWGACLLRWILNNRLQINA
jgi:uncharacterized protein involved in response to NO